MTNTSSVKKLVFFILLILSAAWCGLFFTCNNFAFAMEKQVCVMHSDNNLNLVLDLTSGECSLLRQKINNSSRSEQLSVIQKIMSMGFTLEEALCYVFPNLNESINKIDNQMLINPQNAQVVAGDNDCKISYKNAKNGIKLNKNALFCDFYNYLQTGAKIGVKTVDVYPKITLKDIQNKYVLVSRFETNFSSSSPERKNNIKVACKAINGKFIKAGEIFSFNQATGARDLANGYQKAKIIENGAFVDGIGGGVCQVSSTLYNSCLLAGLSTVEVHNHSMPVGYVQPAFDAMVSGGSADLKIKNNTQNDFLITTSSNQDKCLICIYGVMPKYQIRCRYDKYQVIPPPADIVETDAAKYGDQYGAGEHRLSCGANGYKAKGYVDYYQDGVLIKSELIRDSTYNAKPGIVLVV